MQPNQQVLDLNRKAYEFKQSGQLDKAIECLQQALAIDPNSPETNYNLGTALKNTGQLKAALEFLEKSARLAPNSTAPLNNLALCLNELGNFKQSISVLEKALKIEPDNPLLHYNLANIYLEREKYSQAILTYGKAANLEPNNPQVHANLGIAYLMTSNKKAVSAFKKAIELEPQNPQYHYTLAYVYEKGGKISDAIESYKKTINLDPDYEFALSHLFTMKRKICDWEGLEKIDRLLDKSHRESPWSSILRTENLKSNLLASKNWSRSIEEKAPKRLFSFKDRKLKAGQKIRLGYISGHFGNNPVTFTTAGAFSLHNLKKFDLRIYSYGAQDGFTELIKQSTKNFIDLGKLTDEEAAEKIYRDKIDILVDLSGFTEGNRSEILAMRPAPIQITWAGLSATTGSTFIDYFIADKVIVPKKDQKFYSEKMLYIPNCFCPFNQNLKLTLKKYTRKDFGLPENEFVFAVFNQMYKIEPQAFKSWMNILRNLPGSVLWITSQNPQAEDNLRQKAEKYGVDLKRLIFTKQSGIEEFASRISLADLCLDTLIYGGGTTTYFCLNQGVPVLTFKGSHPASGWTASLLKEAKLDILITKTMQEYENLAIHLATDTKQLIGIKGIVEKFKNGIDPANRRKIKILEEKYLQIVKDRD